MDRDFLTDLFSGFGPVTLRRMFSGYGISVDGTNFALALRAGLYFRADEETIPQFQAEGSKPFQYQQRSTAKVVTVNSYWELPARLFDDQEELAGWARAALAAAQRAALRKRPRTKTAAPKKPARKKTKVPAKKAVTKKPAAKKMTAVKRHAVVPAKRSASRQLLCRLGDRICFPVAEHSVEDGQELSGDGN
jgi:DNA transformation protein and related proteins